MYVIGSILITNNVTPQLGQFILFETDEGQTKVECRFETETLWLTQNLIAELYQKSVPTINEHLSNISSEGELEQNATIRNFRIVRKESAREFAELKTRNGKLMKIAEWASKLDDFLCLSDYEVLNFAGNISQVQVTEIAKQEYYKYRKVIDTQPSKVDLDLAMY